MTASPAPAPARAQASPPIAVRARDVLASEWTKFRSVRSTFWTLLVAVVTPIGSTLLVAVALSSQPRGAPPIDPMLPIFISLDYAVLAIGVRGVMAFSTEYSTGLIRTTFAAVPHRRAVLAAKAAVTGAVTLVAGEIVAFATFFVAQALLSSHHLGVSLSHPGALGAVLADGLILPVTALMGVGLGAITRHTAGGIAAVVALIILPATLALLRPPWGGRLGRFTLLDAAHQVTALHPAADLFAPALSLVVLLAWPALILLAAGLVITRRDA
ncbi:MAG TPA: ABC transporter permease [Streptosporangiaceae bacterium]|nr:ABC transporter permease [Streptosporangiaceae bacterium]